MRGEWCDRQGGDTGGRNKELEEGGGMEEGEMSVRV